jgi:hypothetical protein
VAGLALSADRALLHDAAPSTSEARAGHGDVNRLAAGAAGLNLEAASLFRPPGAAALPFSDGTSGRRGKPSPAAACFLPLPTPTPTPSFTSAMKRKISRAPPLPWRCQNRADLPQDDTNHRDKQRWKHPIALLDSKRPKTSREWNGREEEPGGRGETNSPPPGNGDSDSRAPGPCEFLRFVAAAAPSESLSSRGCRGRHPPRS